jgi:hypothetical protein
MWDYIQMLRNEPQRRRDTETLEVEFRAVFGWPVLARPRAGRAWSRARGRCPWARLGRAVARAGQLAGKAIASEGREYASGKTGCDDFFLLFPLS